MIGKCVDVLHDDSAPLHSRRTAYTASESNLEAAQGALIGAYPHQVTRFDHSIESGPQKTERVVHERADGRHLRDLVIDPLQHRVDVTGKFPISL